jgi:uncharacterized protein YggE
MNTSRLAALAAVVVVAAVAGAAALRPDPAHGDAAPVSDKGVVVTGTGSVTAVPDRGSFTFGVTSRAATAAAAVRANAAAMTAIVAALRKAGVAAADLQTTQASLEQQQSGDGQRVTGSAATGSVLAQVRDLGRAGAIVDAAVAAGASSFYGPSLATADADKLYARALAAAVADARAKAKTLADTSGLSLGRITSVVEGGGSDAMPYASSAKSADSVAIEPGTQEVQATVTVSFATT